MSLSPNAQPEVPISPGVPRRRIHPTLLAELDRSLGKRDFAKGERAAINEVLEHMRSQAASLGYHSEPMRPDDLTEPELDADGKPLLDELDRPRLRVVRRRDTPELRAFKAAKLDGVARMFGDHPELCQPDEEKILERLLYEAALHDLRPHAGHTRATPTHLVEAERARRATSKDEADRAQIQHARVEAARAASPELAKLQGRVDAMEGKLDAILAALAPKAAPTQTPNEGASAPEGQTK